MTRLDIILANRGGTLDVQTASSPQDAIRALIAMLNEMGELHDGDTITVETHPDDR